MKNPLAGCFDALHFTGKSDLMEAARPHQCQLVVRALCSAVLYMKALAMTGPDGQMFASCFNCTVKRNTVSSSTSGSKRQAVQREEAVTGHPVQNPRPQLF